MSNKEIALQITLEAMRTNMVGEISGKPVADSAVAYAELMAEITNAYLNKVLENLEGK